MSAWLCRKRVSFDEAGCPSTPKKSRCSSFGSPIRPSDFGSGSEDKIPILVQMFPAMNPELVETVLKTHNGKLEDAVESLHALSAGNVDTRNESHCLGPGPSSYLAAPSGGQMTVENVENDPSFDLGCTMAGSKWVDLFLHEMMNATGVDDARGKAARVFEAFSKSSTDNSSASKEASVREYLGVLLRENQTLKRAVSIQHERNTELEHKANEVQQLKILIHQYQEQLRTLQLSNYALKLHLQRAQEGRSIPGQFHPDVF